MLIFVDNMFLNHLYTSYPFFVDKSYFYIFFIHNNNHSTRHFSENILLYNVYNSYSNSVNMFQKIELSTISTISTTIFINTIPPISKN